MLDASRLWLVAPLLVGATWLAVACGGSESSGSGLTRLPDGGLSPVGTGGTAAAKTCATSGDCAPPSPYCDNTSGLCVACLGNANCAGTRTPICNVTTHACAECAQSTDCPNIAPYCDATAGRCVQCVTDANCGDPALACNGTTHLCVHKCAGNGDCAAPTAYCDTSSSVCVECLADGNCANDPRRPACSTTTHACVACNTDANCAATNGRPHCDTTMNRCVACVTDANCGQGQTCANGDCNGCGANQTVCGGGNCVDTQTDPRNCGQCGKQCGNGQSCVSGQCGCRTGLTSCTTALGTQCVDTKSNPLACGGCGDLQTGTNVCAAGDQCQGGACQPSTMGCAAPTPDACQLRMGGGNRVACVDRQTDPLNCGNCGNVCAATEQCVNGNCR